MNERDLFGPACGCDSLPELMALQRTVVGDAASQAVAAYAMIVSAREAPAGIYHQHALGVLDCLGAAKMALDKSACHALSTVAVTAAILGGAQQIVEETTIPCTEWPSSDEVLAVVLRIAARYAFAGPWRRTLHGPRGEIIGVEEFQR